VCVSPERNHGHDRDDDHDRHHSRH